MRKRVKLTARDYYNANNPEYLNDHPDVKEALVSMQKKCIPATCIGCYFFRWSVKEDWIDGATCSIGGDINPDFGERDKSCPL